MKGIRFYHEFKDTRKKHPEGNVMAVMTDKRGFPDIRFQGKEAMVDVISAVFDHPNSGVAGSSASIKYLRSRTKRISEEKARKIHPNLFYYLDNSP